MLPLWLFLRGGLEVRLPLEGKAFLLLPGLPPFSLPFRGWYAIMISV